MTHTRIEHDPRCGKKELGRLAAIIVSRSTGLAQSHSRVISALQGFRTRDNKRYLGNGTIYESVREQALELLAQREAGQAWPTPSELRNAQDKRVLAKLAPEADAQITTLRAQAQELCETNAKLSQRNIELLARNAALEENDTHMAAELERRQDELVAQGKKLKHTVLRTDHEQYVKDMHIRHEDEVEQLEAEVKRLITELAQLRKDYTHLQSVNDRNAERIYEAEDKVEEIEAENTLLRIALHKLAEASACALKALLPA